MGSNENNGSNSLGNGNAPIRLETLVSFLAIATFIALFGCFMFEWGYFDSKDISIVDLPVSLLDFDTTLTRIPPLVLIYLTMFLAYELIVGRTPFSCGWITKIGIWILTNFVAVVVGWFLLTRDWISEVVVIFVVMIYALLLGIAIEKFGKDIKSHQNIGSLIIVVLLGLAVSYISGITNYRLHEVLSNGQHRICTKEAVYGAPHLVADDFRSFSEWVFVWKKESEKEGEAVWINRASVTAIIPVENQSKAAMPCPMSGEPEREADFQREGSLKGRDLGSSEDDRDASDRADMSVGESLIPRGEQPADGHQAGGPGGQGAAEGIPGEGDGPVEGGGGAAGPSASGDWRVGGPSARATGEAAPAQVHGRGHPPDGGN